MKVLLVEDEEELRVALRSALERDRYVVDCVEDLALAEEAARNTMYDVMLLDRTLPISCSTSIGSTPKRSRKRSTWRPLRVASSPISRR
jgi:DNA-binding response OmpR family regulator